ncbi:MAG: peptidase S10 [Gammaproteobacteria bacterium]
MKMKIAVICGVLLFEGLASTTIANAAAPAEGAAIGKSASTPSDLVTSEGAVTVGGKRIDYRAVAGTLVVHPKGWDDAASDGGNAPVASMFYAAYFKKGAPARERPITFIYNGGPGSSTMWLHMGSFGPKRVLIKVGEQTTAPYTVVENRSSLLDVTDVVFIDAPGTGFSRISGADKEKAFFGLDADAHAFAEFITGFLSRHQRWGSPRFLFGESYGATRTAILVNLLINEYSVDVNGVVLLSQVLNNDLSAKVAQFNPGTDDGYIVSLPSYAATAWYYNKLPGTRPRELEPFLREVEQFATSEYAVALHAGAALDPTRREAMARKLSELTGLPAAYILKSNLRVGSGQFRKMLLDDQGLTLGMCDARFSAPSIDPLSKEADNSVLPDLAMTLSAYVSSVNDYVRTTLGYGGEKAYKPMIDDSSWTYERPQPPGAPTKIIGIMNVMTDLATAMKSNPKLEVLVTAGYYDFCTTYYESAFEMRHLPLPDSLRKNIEYQFYPTGHWPYNTDETLRSMHDKVADFIRRLAGVRAGE